MTICGLVVVGPLQAWILLKYGFAAKIASNPAVAGRDTTPLLFKTVHTTVTSFVTRSARRSEWPKRNRSG